MCKSRVGNNVTIAFPLFTTCNNLGPLFSGAAGRLTVDRNESRSKFSSWADFEPSSALNLFITRPSILLRTLKNVFTIQLPRVHFKLQSAQ